MTITTARRSTLEIIAVIITGLLKFLMVDVWNAKFVYVTGAVICWAIYIIVRRRTDAGVLSGWGFTREKFSSSWKYCAVFGTSAIVLMGLYARFTDNFMLHWHMIPILLLYPLWGIIQQFLMMALIAGNLEKLKKPYVFIVLFTAVMFSIVHYPSWILVAGTFGLAIFYTIVFLRFRNLWPLGLFHGWIGCFFFYWVLHRDPWMEFTRMIQ